MGACDVPALREAVGRSLAARAPFRELEVQCTLPGENRKEFLVAGCPIQAAGGSLMLLVAIDDITERRMLEDSERHARLEAEQANRAKDLFLATLSHESARPSIRF